MEGSRLKWIVAATIAAAPIFADAHAIIMNARPAPHTTVAPGRVDISLAFNSRIDRQRSRLSVRGPDGREAVVTRDAHGAPGALSGHAEVTAPGAWTVRWQVLSQDGHITRGEIPFDVR